MSTATSTTSRTRNAGNESDLCQFPFQDGRRCRLLRHPKHSCLCIFHARAESQLIETERLGRELGETLSGDFMSATDINHAMGRLYVAVAQDRIPVRRANTLARIGGSLLRSVKEIDWDTVLARATIANPKGMLIDSQLVRVALESGTPEEKVVISGQYQLQQGTLVAATLADAPPAAAGVAARRCRPTFR